MESGSALIDISADPTHSNFTFVAAGLGCGSDNTSTELDCMRQVSIRDIENFVGRYQDSEVEPTISFTPTPDEKIVFSNYTERYAIGALAKIPAILSNTANEGVALIGYPDEPNAGPNLTAADALTKSYFLCPAAQSAKLRAALGLTTYRYEFAGNFSNISPRWWMGAYHSSDLPFLFGTHSDYRGESTEREFRVSEAMESFLLGFMTDPENAVGNGADVVEWPKYSEQQMLRFGADEEVVVKLGIDEIEGVC